MKDTGTENRTLRVRLRHPETEATLELRLPADTPFGALDALVYAQGFVLPQKPGYGYLAAGHLCSNGHTLGDYVPAWSEELELRMLGIPQIMV